MCTARCAPIPYDVLTGLNKSVVPNRELVQSLRKAGLLRKDVTLYHHYRGRRSGSRHPRRSSSPYSTGRHLKDISTSNLAFGLLNVRSLNNKVDKILDLLRCESIDVIFLTETWHDATSVALCRLRAAAYTVIDRPRPRDLDAAASASLHVNHGGVAIVAAAGVKLQPHVFDITITTFEFISARFQSTHGNLTTLVVYRTGPLTSLFFSELDNLLSCMSVMKEVLIVGDFNIRLDRPNEPHTRAFTKSLSSHGFALRVHQPTHDLGGILDVVATRRSLSVRGMDVIPVDFSDHRLLRWMSVFSRPPPVYKTIVSRKWKQLDLEKFFMLIQSNNSADIDATDVDVSASQFNNAILSAVDQLIPLKTARVRLRQSDPWYDGECRVMKRQMRRMEKRALKTGSVSDRNNWRSDQKAYRRLMRSRRDSYWKETFVKNCKSSCQMWRSLNHIMGRGKAPPAHSISVDNFLEHFTSKIDRVRAASSDAPAPLFPATPMSARLNEFRPTTEDEVIRLILSLPNKQCLLDPIPTWLLKKISLDIAPVLVRLFNKSLLSGKVPLIYKSCYITPLIKKSTLDPTDVNSYRPISNLSVFSKLLERLVLTRVLEHLDQHNLLPVHQSAYRRCHSTETAVLRVSSDLLRAAGDGELSLLVLLDLSAAFDTVDHSILLRRLEASFGLGSVVLAWFQSYLTGRSFSVRSGALASSATSLTCGVPQGSVLGPLLFTLYTAELEEVIKAHGLQCHMYADDTQVYGRCRPEHTDSLAIKISRCVDAVDRWMFSSRLLLNANKTEVMWCSSSRRSFTLPTKPVRICSDLILPVRCVRNLGIWLDSDCSMASHINNTTRSCYASLREIRSIAAPLSIDVRRILITALVLPKIDYGISTLAGLPSCHLDRLQILINTAAKTIHGARKYDHVTPLLRELHWLRIRQRIEYKIATMVYKSLNGHAPPYLSFAHVTDVPGRRRLRSASRGFLLTPPARCTTLDGRSIDVIGPQLWNKLPRHITTSSSLASFHTALKTFLFTKSFPSSQQWS